MTPGTLDGAIYYGDPVERGHPLNRGLVSWWLPLPWYRSGPRLIDIAGRNHGTLTNGPTWVPGPRGGFGAVRFAAANAMVSVPSTSALQVATGSFTLGARFRIDSLSNQYQGILVKSPSTQGEYGFAINEGGVAGQVFTNGIAATNTIAGATLTTGVWYDMLLVRNGADSTAQCYVNGGLTQSKAAASAGSNTSNALELGTGTGGFSDFTGSMAWAGVWNRALSARDATDLYDQSRRNHPDTLRRTRPWSFGVEAGGGGGGFQAAWARGSNTVITPNVI